MIEKPGWYSSFVPILKKNVISILFITITFVAIFDREQKPKWSFKRLLKRWHFSITHNKTICKRAFLSISPCNFFYYQLTFSMTCLTWQEIVSDWFMIELFKMNFFLFLESGDIYRSSREFLWLQTTVIYTMPLGRPIYMFLECMNTFVFQPMHAQYTTVAGITNFSPKTNYEHFCLLNQNNIIKL